MIGILGGVVQSPPCSKSKNASVGESTPAWSIGGGLEVGFGDNVPRMVSGVSLPRGGRYVSPSITLTCEPKYIAQRVIK